MFKPAAIPLPFRGLGANNPGMAASRTDLSAREAELLAIQALGFLAEEPERLERFLALTGIGIETLTRDAGNPAVLTAILNHLLKDESLLLTLAANNGAAPTDIARAHDRLERGGHGSG